jgi:hypothetical protein
LVDLTITRHNYEEGAIIRVTGTTNYDQRYDVREGSTTDKVRVQAPYVAETFVKNLDAAAAVDAGGGFVDIPLTGHGYTKGSGNHVTLAGTTNYNGVHQVTSGSTTNFIRIAATFTAETFTGSETCNAASCTNKSILKFQGFNVGLQNVFIEKAACNCLEAKTGQINALHVDNVECQFAGGAGMVLHGINKIFGTKLSVENNGIGIVFKSSNDNAHTIPDSYFGKMDGIYLEAMRGPAIIAFGVQDLIIEGMHPFNDAEISLRSVYRKGRMLGCNSVIIDCTDQRGGKILIDEGCNGNVVYAPPLSDTNF